MATRQGLAPPARSGPAVDRRGVLTVWVVSRVVVLAVVVTAGLAAGVQPGESLLHWDAGHFAEIARYGYGGVAGDGRGDQDTPLAAFFPGLPLLLAALHAVGIPYALGGVLVSAVTGGVAALALARLAAVTEPDGATSSSPPGPTQVGLRAVLLWVAAPSAVFLAVGYSEAPFLGFALPAWLAARDDRWALAGALAAAATCFRITGVFLVVALLVMWAQHRSRPRGERRPTAWSVAWLALPVVPLAAFTRWLQRVTGDPLAWLAAQQQGWDRTWTWPWTAWAATWDAAWRDPSLPASHVLGFRLELAAMVVGVLLTVGLAVTRRWPELGYVGLQVVALGTSAYYLSVPRAMLLWWPLWTVLAAWTLRAQGRRGTHLRLAALLVLTVPLAVVLAVNFGQGSWAG